jgi:hypothetical protein
LGEEEPRKPVKWWVTEVDPFLEESESGSEISNV